MFIYYEKVTQYLSTLATNIGLGNVEESSHRTGHRPRTQASHCRREFAQELDTGHKHKPRRCRREFAQELDTGHEHRPRTVEENSHRIWTQATNIGLTL